MLFACPAFDISFSLDNLNTILNIFIKHHIYVDQFRVICHDSVHFYDGRVINHPLMFLCTVR